LKVIKSKNQKVAINSQNIIKKGNKIQILQLLLFTVKLWPSHSYKFLKDRLDHFEAGQWDESWW